MPIGKALIAFRKELAVYNGYISKAYTQDAAGAYILNPTEQAFVIDSAFLRMFISWEVFLEEAFVQFLLGQASAGGKIASRLASPPDAQHARELLIGTQKYVDWANPEIVRKLAKLVFVNGEPIAPVISSVQTDLFDLKTVRNAAAHLTSTTGRHLDALATRKLLGTRTNILVSDFLLATDPSSGSTVLSGYLGQLDLAAEKIANWT